MTLRIGQRYRVTFEGTYCLSRFGEHYLELEDSEKFIFDEDDVRTGTWELVTPKYEHGDIWATRQPYNISMGPLWCATRTGRFRNCENGNELGADDFFHTFPDAYCLLAAKDYE